MNLNQEEKQRYSRHLLLPEFGIERQEKLKKSSVLVIGAGGLGCPVLQYLTAAGVGNIGILDFDTVDVSNLQRQILFTVKDIGKSKAKVAGERLAMLNPHVSFDIHDTKLSKENALDILKNYDLILDGSDNFKTRYLVNDACVMLNKPLVYGAIFKFTGQVSVFNFQGSATYRCLFPDAPEEGDMPNCSEIGVLGVLPAVIGSLQANEAIKILAEIGEPLPDTLLTYDALTTQFETFNFTLNPENLQINQLEEIEENCYVNSTEKKVSLAEVDKIIEENNPDYQVIDVREEYEHEVYNIGGLNIPLYELEERIEEIETEKKNIFYCQSGQRSRIAVQILEEKGIFAMNLEDGLGA